MNKAQIKHMLQFEAMRVLQHYRDSMLMIQYVYRSTKYRDARVYHYIPKIFDVCFNPHALAVFLAVSLPFSQLKLKNSDNLECWNKFDAVSLVCCGIEYHERM